MELKPGMVGLSGGRSFMQRAIRYFIGSKFSHSFTVIDVSGVISALETTETRITVTSMERKLSESNWVQIWEVVALEEFKEMAVLNSYRNYSGEFYGYGSYLWFIYRWIMRKFGIEKTKMWSWCDSGITCTELTCDYLATLWPELFPNDLNTYSPEELRKILLANPDKFICLGWYKE